MVYFYGFISFIIMSMICGGLGIIIFSSIIKESSSHNFLVGLSSSTTSTFISVNIAYKIMLYMADDFFKPLYLFVPLLILYILFEHDQFKSRATPSSFGNFIGAILGSVLLIIEYNAY